MEVDITDQVKDHMDRQPYDMVCSVCCGRLTFTKDIDGDLDMTLEIAPCETCLKEAREEGKEG